MFLERRDAGIKAAVYAGTQNLYSDMVTAAKSLVMHSSVDIIYFLIESDRFPYYLPPFIKTINISNQGYFSKWGSNARKKWTYMTLMRCALTKCFPALDKILWLDVDTLVQNSIDELWDLDMGDCYFAGVKEPEKSKPDAPYINAGVLMLNLEKLREDGMDDVLISTLNSKEYEFPDQDCINEICRNKILLIPSMYNANNFTEACDIPKIRHFAAETNWRNKSILYPYRNKNWNEVRKTQ